MNKKYNWRENLVISTLNKFKGEWLTVDEIEAEIDEVMNTRAIRKTVADISNDLSNKTIILSSTKGFMIQEELNAKEVQEIALKLRIRALKLLKRSYTLSKKVGLPTKDLFEINKEEVLDEKDC